MIKYKKIEDIKDINIKCEGLRISEKVLQEFKKLLLQKKPAFQNNIIVESFSFREENGMIIKTYDFSTMFYAICKHKYSDAIRIWEFKNINNNLNDEATDNHFDFKYNDYRGAAKFIFAKIKNTYSK